MLDPKNRLKMIEFSSSSQENEIHKVDSTFKEISKNIFFLQGGPNFWGETVGKFRGKGQ